MWTYNNVPDKCFLGTLLNLSVPVSRMLFMIADVILLLSFWEIEN